MNLKCKNKIENFLTKKNLVDSNNILELFTEQNLENIIYKLESLVFVKSSLLPLLIK